MARPRKVPAVLVEATIRENGKLAELPSDTARLGYVYICLGAAKLLQPVPGVFASKAHFKEVAGRFGRYLTAYLQVGLLEEAPRLCPKCKTAWASMPPARGQIVTHDWHEHQYDPRKIERQREYEDRQRAAAAAAAEAPVSDAVSDGVSDAQSDAQSDAVSDGDSRARTDARVPGARRTLNVEQENDESGSLPVENRARNGTGPTLSKRERDAWSTFGSEWDEVKAVWIARGLRLPPAGAPSEGDESTQRGVLFQVLDARPGDLVRWIREAPGKSSHDVVRHVLEQWHAVRAEAGVDDDVPAAWLGPSRTEAAESLGEILAKVGKT